MPTRWDYAEGHSPKVTVAGPREPHVVGDPEHVCKHLAREPGELQLPLQMAMGAQREGRGRTPLMDELEQSDRPVVPAKLANKAGQPAAEPVEGRGLAKRNPPEADTYRILGRGSVRSGLERIRQAAQRDREVRFTSLYHQVYALDMLWEAYVSLERAAAPGVDGETWQHYGEDLEANLRDLSERLRRGAYRAQPVTRAYIPKGDGRQRPLGVPVLEDKIVQRATVAVLNAIYDTEFLGFSYGFRAGRSQHDALAALDQGLLTKKVNWVLDADIRGFLEASTHYPSRSSRWWKSGPTEVAGVCGSSIRRPLRRPERRCMARSSPRFTRCNTVCRETPSASVASNMATQPGGASSTNVLRRSSVMRMRHGAPGVNCSPATKPSASQRCSVDGAMPRTAAALAMVSNSPCWSARGSA